jgi:cell division protease FtsH
VLTDNLDELHKLAEALLEYETLSGDEAKRAIKGEPIERDRDRGNKAKPIAGGSSVPGTRRPGGIGGPAVAGTRSSLPEA